MRKDIVQPKKRRVKRDTNRFASSSYTIAEVLRYTCFKFFKNLLEGFGPKKGGDFSLRKESNDPQKLIKVYFSLQIARLSGVKITKIRDMKILRLGHLYCKFKRNQIRYCRNNKSYFGKK
jgi:hypothetical protein